ncbi:type IV pilus modification protein PilV [Steroidobacter agaridevorans]|uniref:Type IV pilus modification protein PilV n=1 Tax=Steroidobacter agaridevorans TaxID=2695856 RepID=A0A829YC48_9GAMM|nr:type IV pilus modification protein PilV [Steroidobacter agaridevorans]GFE80839.1 type IV pilus modification protein PilV [Steroidobacter agaridevorans]GFE87940.1 type IV pilus modification protein PilV [Steroidobacter agaridevorans]
MNAHRFQTGFTIVEVLVALVVLAVGMLGMASLYVTTLRSSGTALSRMQAVTLAADMADRIRANRFARALYETEEPVEQDCIADGDCTREQMVANDLFVWQEQIDEVLPGEDPEGTIEYTAPTATTPDSYTITVTWKEAQSEGNDAEELRYVLTMEVAP